MLDILRDEGLQANARTVGAHLKARLEELARRHELVGAVHGTGLRPAADFFVDALDLVLAEGWRPGKRAPAGLAGV